MKNKILKVVSIIAALFLVSVTVIYLEDRRFWDRYLLMLTHEGVLPQSGWVGSEYPVEGGNHHFFELASTGERTISDEALEDITAYAADRNSTSLLVWHRGKLQLREYFQGYDSNSFIVGKSMAKMVVGIVIGRAIKQGYISSLDEPAANYINEWQGSEKEAISIRHLLHMAAGFEKFYTLDFSPFSDFMRSYLSGYHEQVMINNYQLVDVPGTQYDYSQVSSDLLGLILERATAKPYGEYLSEVLIKPIGAQGGEVMMNRPGGVAHTGCCLLLPSESWLRMGIFLMQAGMVNGESLFPEGWMEEYLQPSPANPALGLHIWLGEPYIKNRSFGEVGEAKGFGVFHSEPYLASDLFMFDGNGHQVIYIIPSLELVIVRTGNWPRGENFKWDNAYIPNTVIRSILD